jgi:hypothetical protein
VVDGAGEANRRYAMAAVDEGRKAGRGRRDRIGSRRSNQAVEETYQEELDKDNLTQRPIAADRRRRTRI